MQFTDTIIEEYERHAHEREANFPDEFKKTGAARVSKIIEQ